MLKELFKEIWDERKIADEEGAEYVSCVDCGKRIYEQNLKVHHFSHTHSKGNSPHLKFEKSNVQIRCFACHSFLDNGLKIKYNIID